MAAEKRSALRLLRSVRVPFPEPEITGRSSPVVALANVSGAAEVVWYNRIFSI
jgi:hypothetical protein